MLKRLEAHLTLGCQGDEKHGFIHCQGVRNVVLKLEDLSKEKYDEIVKFLDQACGLFDSPVTDFNKCANMIGLLHKNHIVFTDPELFNIQKFLKNHKECKVYMILVPKEDSNE